MSAMSTDGLAGSLRGPRTMAQREVRTPKIVLTDPGMALALRGMDADALARPEIA